MSETTAPPKFTFATLITLVAIVAQGLMTVELFMPSSVPGKVLQVLAMVLTALGAPLVARAGSKVLPTALLVLLVVNLAGCDQAKTTGIRAATSFVDCMQPQAVRLATELKPTFRDLLENATQPDGKIDWAPVRAAASSLKTPATRCAFSTVVSEAMRLVARAADAVQSAPLDIDQTDLRQGWEAIRADFWQGERYKLESGTL
jgi:hypothetical protein